MLMLEASDDVVPRREPHDLVGRVRGGAALVLELGNGRDDGPEGGAVIGLHDNPIAGPGHRSAWSIVKQKRMGAAYRRQLGGHETDGSGGASHSRRAETATAARITCRRSTGGPPGAAG